MTCFAEPCWAGAFAMTKQAAGLPIMHATLLQGHMVLVGHAEALGPEDRSVLRRWDGSWDMLAHLDVFLPEARQVRLRMQGCWLTQAMAAHLNKWCGFLEKGICVPQQAQAARC